MRTRQSAMISMLIPVALTAQQPAPSPLALTGVTVIDGTGGPAMPAMTVLLEGDRNRVETRGASDTTATSSRARCSSGWTAPRT